MNWTPWQPLASSISFTETDLKETLDGGQAFRWRAFEYQDGIIWEGIWEKKIAQIRKEPNKRISARFPSSNSEDMIASLGSYLGAAVDWADLRDRLPWRSDEHLERCIQMFPTLRLLSQPFGETLLAFLCSATKRIPQIKVMCSNLAKSLGSEIAPGIHAMPDWIQISAASESELRSLGLGFRAKNIKRTADFLARSPDLLPRLETSSYLEAKEGLMKLPGVGSKIADCSLLFGAGKLEAFPVDTWIIKAMEKRYALQGWNPSQIELFGRSHFGNVAGYAQQFLFSYERHASS